MSYFMCYLLLLWPKPSDAVDTTLKVAINKLAFDFLFYMTTNIVSKFHQNPDQSKHKMVLL